jgi:hypothetical protein
MSEHEQRLEYLRQELRAERISYGELAELQSLAEHIEPGDVELLEAAGVPEHQATYEREAFELGAEHARNAASWAVDGRMSHKDIARILAVLEEGDSEDVAEYLPARPNLSGEWADDPTPGSLFRAITGRRPEEADDDVVDALCDAYERGVDETFEAECERVLRAAL